MIIQLPSVDEVRSILRYEPKTGKLYWLERPQSMFTRERFCKAWNTRYAGQEAFTAPRQGYLAGQIFNKRLLSHRVIWALIHGEWPPEFIDHIDGNPLNNRIENLRAVSHSENCKNARKSKRNSSGVIGVSWNSRNKRWVAYISTDGRRKSLGYFKQKQEAIRCRKKAERDYGYHYNHGRDAL
jgi:hypothetical protein